MNLFIFNENRRGTVFGIGTYIRELTLALKDSDIHISVVNLLSDQPQIHIEEKDGILYWHIPEPVSEYWSVDNKEQRMLYFSNLVYLLQLQIKDQTDLVFHLNYHRNNTFADRLRETFDCKIVSVAHFSDWGFSVFDNPQHLRNILNEEKLDSFSANVKSLFEDEKEDYMKVDHLIVLSDYMREIICRDYNFTPQKVSVIPNGLSDVADTLTNPILLRKKWHIGLEEKIILFAGRVDEIKGINFLIKAFHKVMEVHSNSRLVIAGNGNYNKIFQETKSICTKVIFTGLLEKKDLYEMYRIADVGVVPSLFEPFGYVPVEMMMHELPIVATATSGLNEVVDESCGLKVPLIVSPDNVEIDTSLLAQKIIYLLQNPKEAKRLGKNGRKRYLEKYSSEVFGKNMIAFYKSLFQECK